MLEKATEKLTNEMTSNPTQPYVQVVGQYLLNHLEAQPEHADNILAEDKTILKSLDVMRRFAERKKVGTLRYSRTTKGLPLYSNTSGVGKANRLSFHLNRNVQSINHLFNGLQERTSRRNQRR